MKKIKILFQGDSVTDCGRIRQDPTSIGGGYPEKSAAALKKKYPDVELEFRNLACGGDQTKDLVARLETDFIDIQPDIVSILVGVNDVWHYAEDRKWQPHDLFEERYRTVLKAIKERTNAKIMMIEPFLMPVPDKLYFREDLAPKIEIIRKLAREYADILIPLDGIMNSGAVNTEPELLASDGVHPTSAGSDIIAESYVKYISVLIDELIAE